MKSHDRHIERLLKSAFRSRLKGGVYFDDQTRLQYATAACNYRVFPQCVVMPRDGDDVSEVIRIARDLNVPVTPRGAGAGLTGGCLGNGIILDFSRYMNRILSIDIQQQTVIVEPGVVQGDLDRALLRHRFFFPPDPSSRMYSTLGGMVGNNAAGPHSVKYGVTRDYLLSVSAVCGDGEEVTFRNDMEYESLPPGRLRSLGAQLFPLLQANDSLFQRFLPKTRKNASGYRVDHVLEGNRLHIANLMAASEGTLGVFTGFELRIAPMPDAVGMVLLFFDSVDACCESVPQIAEMNPSMLEIMESTFVDLVRKSAFDVGVPFPMNLRSMLLVEFDGQSAEEVNDRIRSLERLVVGPGRPAMSSRRGMQQEERNRLDRIRQAASPILNRYPPPFKPIKFIEDTVVPVHHLPRYISKMHALFEMHGVRGVIYGHAGDGHIHVNPLMNTSRSDLVKTMQQMADTTYELIREFDGTLSGEHGDGLLRTPYLSAFFGPAYDVFKEIKRCFDPEGILNPGKIVSVDHRRFTDDMKFHFPRTVRATETVLDQDRVTDALFACSSCGACRNYCPVFIASGDERTTPRSKANVLTRMISTDFPAENDLIGVAHKQVFDHCIQCGTCLTECPSGVNIPLLMELAKNVSIDHNGMAIQDRVLSETGFSVDAARILPKLSNALLENRVVRKALELTLGLDSRRKLAPFTDIELSSLVPEMTQPAGRKIVYFPGCTAEANDPWGEGASILAVLSHHGYSPFIPDLECCGIAGITMGRLDRIRPQAARNIALLHEMTRGGMMIVTGSPSCAMALRHEYPELMETSTAREVADRVRDIHELLVELLSNGRLDSRFEPVRMKIAVHQPCHARAMGAGQYPARLLELIPGLTVHRLEPRCCGMAGTFGMKKKNLDFSFRIGDRLFREIKAIKPDLVATACGTCRIQIEAATGIDTVHPISLLAEAYGLMPARFGLLKNVKV
ncbi:anaerobic glycerol-3-phosphate dehydrogenase subunit C [bacterium]|nr:anaerobic glycerol-3-phosphate dehydrogenase subunit C [candidate division CSSED10-310 bacterium]